MILNLPGIITAVTGHAVTTGLFDRVQYTEQPRGAGNGKGLTVETWLDRISPVDERSGLAVTTGRIALIVRVKIPIARDPQTTIDTDLAAAAAALFTAYSGDFQLGGSASFIDLLGAHGVPLSGRGDFLTGPPGSTGGYRIFDITLPVIVDDTWPQAE